MRYVVSLLFVLLVPSVYAGVLSGYDVGGVVSAIEEKLAADVRLGVTESHDDRGPVAMLNAEAFSAMASAR